MYIKIFISFLLMLSVISCTYTEKENTVMVVEEQSVSSVISRLKHLNVNQNQAIDDINLQLFLQGYKLIEIGTIDEAEEIFTKLQSSQDKDAIEYGEYGLLLLAYEKGNMLDLERILKNIDSLDKKSPWLNEKLHTYKIVYEYDMGNFKKAKILLGRIPKTEVASDPLLTSIEAGLYIRENKLIEAQAILHKLHLESVDSIAAQARLISLIEGDEKAVDYLAPKLVSYPDNEHLQLMYNIHLLGVDQEKAINNAYELGLKTNNVYILIYSMKILLVDAGNIPQERLDRLEILADTEIFKSSTSKEYIDYYLFQLEVPKVLPETNSNLEAVSKFNPMHYNFILNMIYSVDEEDKLYFIKQLETLDPYDNYTLLLLAEFYASRSMDRELNEIKQRFNKSKRFKTKDEIEFINSL